MDDLGLSNLIDAENKKRKFISVDHKDYDKVICYVSEKTKEGMKRFNPNSKRPIKIESYALTLIRCYFHEAKQKIQKDIDIKQGNCDNCVIRKNAPVVSIGRTYRYERWDVGSSPTGGTTGCVLQWGTGRITFE